LLLEGRRRLQEFLARIEREEGGREVAERRRGGGERNGGWQLAGRKAGGGDAGHKSFREREIEGEGGWSNEEREKKGAGG
jgi:hypothetical protein